MAREGKYKIDNLYNLNPENKNLYVLEAAYHVFAPDEAMAHAAFKDTFCIHYISSGKLKWNDTKILTPGDGFIHTGYPDHFCLERSSDELEYSIIRIGGFSAKTFLKSFNLPVENSWFRHPNTLTIAKLIKDVVSEDSTERNTDCVLTALLYNVMSYHKPETIQKNAVFAPNIAHPSYKNKYILETIAYIDKHYNENISIETIAAKLHLSPDYLSKLFKKSLEKSLQSYIIAYKIEKAKSFLTTTDYSISEISAMVGYPNSQYFSQVFKKYTTYTPTTYRELTNK